MEPIPDDILMQFNAVLEQKKVLSALRDDYQKWLGYYLDFRLNGKGERTMNGGACSGRHPLDETRSSINYQGDINAALIEPNAQRDHKPA
jgi:hypothetical protein